MKKLQRDFTSIEQSKRLLKLGVPADSANFFYVRFGREKFATVPLFCYDHRYSEFVPRGYKKNYCPCWSVGRLIEIFNECSNYNTLSMTSVSNETYIEQLIELYERLINNINFQKLEQ